MGYGRLFLLTESSRNDRKVFFCMWNNNTQSTESEEWQIFEEHNAECQWKNHEEVGLLKECDEDPFCNM